jgi:cell division control protein 12
MGKTTFINTLFATEICTPRNYRHRAAKQLDKTTEIDILKADLEERGFNIKVGIAH